MEVLEYVRCNSCDLGFFIPQVTGSADFYRLLSAKMDETYYLDEKSEYDFASRYITADDSVLDVGSGRGHFRRYIKGRYIGLDFNPQASILAAAEGITVLNESLEQHHSTLQQSYSVVTAFQVLEHMENPATFIRNALDMLQQGGLLIVSVPAEDSFISMQVNAALNMPPHHITRWRDRTLMKLAEIFDLEIVAFEHENLLPIHFDPLMTVLAQRTVSALFNLKMDAMVNLSIKSRLINRLANYIKPVLKNVFVDRSLWPKGHSVTVIYRKTAYN